MYIFVILLHIVMELNEMPHADPSHFFMRSKARHTSAVYISFECTAMTNVRSDRGVVS